MHSGSCAGDGNVRGGFRKQHYGCPKNQMANVVSSGVSIPQQVLQEQHLCGSRWKHGLKGQDGESQERNGHGSADGASYLEMGWFRIEWRKACRKSLLTWPSGSPRVPTWQYLRRSTLVPARVGLWSCMSYTTEQDYRCPLHSGGHPATAATSLLTLPHMRHFVLLIV